MAFDQPLEADSVGEISLFSTLTRAPVVGALLWVLGGNKAREEEEQQRKQQLADAAILTSDVGDDDDDDSGRERTAGANSKLPPKMMNRSTLKRVSSLNASEWTKSPPNLLGSEVSVEECADTTTLDGMSLVRHNTSQGKLKPDGTMAPPSKQLSWSDECGKDLVDYGEESVRKEPLPMQAAPGRSSMSRSRSVKDRMATGTSENRFLPHSLVEKRNNMAAASSEASDGIESPQWGWYIRTTPPTPEMYHSRYFSKKRDSESSTGTVGSTVVAAPLSQSNPVFQGLQDRKKGPPVGWPSVPL